MIKKTKKKDKDKNKNKTFVSTKEISKNESDLKNYHQSKHFAYYDSNYDDDDENLEKFDIAVNLTIVTDVVCRLCKSFFSSNNAFYKHFKVCFKKTNENIHIKINIKTTFVI